LRRRERRLKKRRRRLGKGDRERECCMIKLSGLVCTTCCILHHLWGTWADA
jgi:hypothetical protein